MPYATVGGGYGNNAASSATTIGGGYQNGASGYTATVGGGGRNYADGDYATVGGGRNNNATNHYATIGGGWSNTAAGIRSTIGGGELNYTENTHSTVGGGYSNTASYIAATVGGGRYNTASNWYATIGGGRSNTASGAGSYVGGGGFDGSLVGGNQALGDASTIGGGWGNTIPATGTFAFVGGGGGNTASSSNATVGGGDGNAASAYAATVSGGNHNAASVERATVGGGGNNSASGYAATVPGGYNNTALGAASFAAGQRAKANHAGAFVWSDTTAADFASTGNDQFLIRASGGVGINAASFLTTTTALQVDKGNILVRGTNNFVVDNDEAILYFGDTNHYIKSVANSGVRIGTYSQGDVITILQKDGNVGIGSIDPSDRLDVNGIIRVGSLGAAGADPLCRNASNQIATCSSSQRYKSNIANLNMGLDTIAQLRPVTFDWKGTGAPDLGFVAEEVNQVAPMLTTRNSDGQIEGVKYDRMSAVLVNAAQEQQAQITQLKEQNELLEARLAALEQAKGTDAGIMRPNDWNVLLAFVAGAVGVFAIKLGRKAGAT